MTSWEMRGDAGGEAIRDARAGGGDERDEAVEVLRGVWSASGQTSADLDELFGPAKSCKSMREVGFDALAAESGDLRTGWRAALQREGKLRESQGSLRDLVLGSAEPGDR